MPVEMLAAVIPEMTRPKKKPADGRRECHHKIIKTKSEIRKEYDRSPSESI